MAILHKNISAEGDIHNPKWFSSANNGDAVWRNELGVLESTDELVLPSALEFVDGSVAPPTTNSGDIYVLSSGGSVDAGWGSVSLGDWVRYDGTDWNSITPQKSTLCYNETDDALVSYDGSNWVAIGGDSIYTDSGTVPTSVVATITDSLTFDEGGLIFKGSGTSGNSIGKFQNGSGVDLWDFLDNGDVTMNQDSTYLLGSNILTFNGGVDFLGSSRSNIGVLKIESTGSSDANSSFWNSTGKKGFFGYRSTKDAMYLDANGSANVVLSIGDTTKVNVSSAETTISNTLNATGGLKVNGNSGFTGTGVYTTLTIENGIITNAV